ncbi:MAG TPA: S8 family serine peptidase [Vicinamibacterales bacterium]
MRKLLSLTFLIVAIGSAASYTQSGQILPLVELETPDVPLAPATESTGLWFIELTSPPTAEGSTATDLGREENDFRRAAAAAGVAYTEGRRFRTLWNGLTVRTTGRSAAKLRGVPGVQAVYPVAAVRRQQVEEPPGSVSDMVTALAMTGADVAQAELGLTGRGVRVAVIDSGVDYDHPDLGGCFGRGCRVSKGFDLVGDAFNADPTSPTYNPVPVPDPLPDDCDGHGTHVSGIIGANGSVKGVAPGVTLHAYRVFGCEGSTTADVMLEAMERAFDGGADVVNMSIGSALQWPQYPTAQAADRLVRRGVVVVASIGNEGALGLYAASAPGVGSNVIGVASFDNTHANLASFTVSPDGRRVGYSLATGAPPAPTSGVLPLARTGTSTTTDDACAPLPPGSLAGHVALVRRGTCGFAVKAANAQAAGAAGVALYNNAAGRLNITVVGAVPITIPVVAITAVDGLAIDARIAGGPTDLTWTSLLVSEPQVTGGLVSSFSSYGAAPDLSFKPDLGAPGGSVRSTLPLELGGHGNISGTSMASPHVAGAVALLLEARPRTSPEDALARLQNNATPRPWWGAPALGFLDNVHRQGAGLLSVADAILADAVVAPSRLALGELEDGSVRRVLRLSADAREERRRRGRHRHDDDDAVTYTLGHEPALATGAPTFAPTFFASFATVQFSTPTLTLGGHHRPWDADDARVIVTITPPSDDVSRLFGGYITLTPDDGGSILRVPYTGYNGDYQAITALTPTPFGFPWLASVVGANLVNQPNGATYTMTGDDVPYILFHLDHQVRALKMEVVDVATGRSLHFADDEDFLPRNSAAASFFGFVWDGTTTRRQGGRPREVPNGTYRIELSVLKAGGNPRNPQHTERWTSPEITIARPVS